MTFMEIFPYLLKKLEIEDIIENYSPLYLDLVTIP